MGELDVVDSKCPHCGKEIVVMISWLRPIEEVQVVKKKEDERNG